MQAAVYSERLSTPSTEVRYFYDVTGQMVAVRKLNVATGDTSTVGYAYQGHQQLFSYTLDSDTANHLPASGKITSFNFLGLADEVLAVDSLKGQSVASRQFTAWQFNNLDGTKFTDSRAWTAQAYAFAGQKLASTNTDYLMQSRDASRLTWNPSGPSFAQAFSSVFASEVDVAGQYQRGNYLKAGVYGVGQLAAVGAGTALGFTWAIGAFGVTGGVGLAAGGSALGAANTYASNSSASYAEYGVGIATGAMNPIGEVISSLGGFMGAGISVANGGKFQTGFMAGNIVGGLLGGGLDDYGRALGKISRLKNVSDATKAIMRAEASTHALRYTGASVGLGSAGGLVGLGLGGAEGALMGASIGGAMANFAVACFTAGTPLVVDHAGHSRPIEEIEVGDYVLARNEFDPNGPLELKRVEEKFVRVSPVMELVIEGRSIKTTAEHPFYVPARQTFVPAGELKAGDELVSHDGRLIAIESVNSTDEVATVYNMRVEEHHTYFVGGEVWGWDVWVHNAKYKGFSGADPSSNALGNLFRKRAEDLWDSLPVKQKYGATVAVSRVEGQEVVSLYANIGSGEKQFTQSQIDAFVRSVEESGGLVIHTSGRIHAEQALHMGFNSAPAIGISNPNGPCGACVVYFMRNDYRNVYWPDRS